ncbi:MAG: hypothetical protein A3E81_08705 [Gammaproteobacteria bacterium RIFCSPHIGHO2_12_FULL_36_30]|nr:MAG: hypothetical protein A3E81_08705 [Gammaproteobacteria bacterium RIFCSPHIGHO2_12_FULL_36_30]
MSKIKINIIALCVTLFFSAGSFAVPAILCPSAANIKANYAQGNNNIQDFGNGEYEIFNPLYSTSVVYVINLIPNNIPSALMFLNQVTASYKVHAHVVPSNKNEVYCTYVPYSSAPSLPSASGVIWFKRVS